MGSGSLAAMAVFESQYKSQMSLEEAKALVHAGIMAGINNDLGSGGSVDLMVINKEGHTPLRNCAPRKPTLARGPAAPTARCSPHAPSCPTGTPSHTPYPV